MSTAWKDSLRKESRRKDWQQRLSNIVVLVVLPIGSALSGLFTPDLYAAHGPYSVIFLWLAIIVLYVVFWLQANPAAESLWRLISENRSYEEENNWLKSENERLSYWIEYLGTTTSISYSGMAMVQKYASAGVKTTEDLSESISELLSPIYLKCESLFGVGGSENWNFAVYLYSRDRDELIPVWREKALNHPSGSTTRTWGRGQGHVGKAFVDRRNIITPDAAHPEVWELSAAPPGQGRDYDQDAYKSFASIPIGPFGGDEEMAYGVLVGTSDRVDRFDKSNTIILVQMAQLIALLVIFAKIDVDGIVTLDSDAENET